MIFIISANLSCMAWNEVDWSTWMPPISTPVSCCGKKPLGTTTNSAMLSPTVAISDSSVMRRCRSAHCKVRS